MPRRPRPTSQPPSPCTTGGDIQGCRDKVGRGGKSEGSDKSEGKGGHHEGGGDKSELVFFCGEWHPMGGGGDRSEGVTSVWGNMLGVGKWGGWHFPTESTCVIWPVMKEAAGYKQGVEQPKVSSSLNHGLRSAPMLLPAFFKLREVTSKEIVFSVSWCWSSGNGILLDKWLESNPI